MAARATMILRSLLLFFLAAGLMAAPATAQEQQQPAQEMEEIPEAELETFAEAYIEIMDVRMDLEAQLQAAEDAEQANQLQQQANQEMLVILEEHEIDTRRYQEIVQVLTADPEQRQAFEAIVEELTEGEGGI